MIIINDPVNKHLCTWVFIHILNYLLVFLNFWDWCHKVHHSLPESSSFKVEDWDGPASGPAWQVYKHCSLYENKHRCSELWKSFLTVLLGDDITGLIFEFGIGIANKVTLLLSHALIYCNWPPGSFGTCYVCKFRFKAPAVCGPPQKWFSAEMLRFALTLNALEGYLFLGPAELMETYLHGKAGCSFLCGGTKCPSWRAVSRLSQQQAFLSRLWPRNSCVWVPFCGLSLCSAASFSDLVCSLLLHTIVWSKGHSLPLTPGSVGCTGRFYCAWVECSFFPQVREWLFLSVFNYLTFILYPKGLGGWGDSVAVQEGKISKMTLLFSFFFSSALLRYNWQIKW